MPKFRQHLTINVLVLSAVEWTNQQRETRAGTLVNFDWGRFVANVGAGAFAGAVPDLLEPSLGNPNHRGFWHSLGAAIMVWWVVSGRHTKDLPVELRRILVALGVGYTSHLAADLFLSKAKGMGLANAAF